jgi:glycosyltransferase involved in cell wall biosynthesis
MSPCQEIRTFVSLLQLYRSLKPDIVHHLRIKPVLYGGIAALIARVPATVSAITGLGDLFMGEGLKMRLARLCAAPAFHLALRRSRHVTIFQNPDDRDRFIQAGFCHETASCIIRGAGVDVSTFHFVPEVPGPPLVVLPSRLLWTKGVGEFVAAAAILRREGSPARFILIGAPDTGNPTSVPTAQLEAWRADGLIEWWGWQPLVNMPKLFAGAHIVCLPSYAEGVPLALIQGAAVGRPLVATDVSGCREIVRHGKNGILVPPRDAKALADAIRALVLDPDLRQKFGLEGRKLAVAEFRREKVITETLSVYRKLLLANMGKLGSFASLPLTKS